MVQNWLKNGTSHFILTLKVGSECVCERSGVQEGSGRCGAKERASGTSKQANKDIKQTKQSQVIAILLHSVLDHCASPREPCPFFSSPIFYLAAMWESESLIWFRNLESKSREKKTRPHVQEVIFQDENVYLNPVYISKHTCMDLFSSKSSKRISGRKLGSYS